MNFADGHIYHLDGQTCFNIKSVLKQTTNWIDIYAVANKCIGGNFFEIC